MSHRHSRLFSLLTALSCGVAGLGAWLSAPSAQAETPFTPATYPIVDGSTATIPLGVAFQNLFTGQNLTQPDPAFNTTDNAYHNLINGDADLILVTSPSADELAAAAAAGVTLEVIPVVDEGFVFLTNADNPVTSLTVDQIRAIYSGKITDWSQVGGPAGPITAYQRPENSGSQTGMEDLVMRGTPLMLAPASWITDTMGRLVSAVTASFNGGAGSLGYSYYYYVTQMYGDLAANPQLSKIKLLGVNGVTPSAQSIRSGDYPLHTAYYIVINQADDVAGNPVQQLKNAMLGTDGQQAAMDAGYVPVDTSIPLPPPTPPDPNGLTSLNEVAPVNPLTITATTEIVFASGGCIAVTRLTVAGLADQALQDEINARFRAKQDAMAGLTGVVCDASPGSPADEPSNAEEVTASVGANFSNVLSLQTALVARPLLGGDATEASDALNIRLDTGADLTPADLFTNGAYVAGMIQLESGSDTLAQAYLDNPNQPFSFTSSAANINGTSIPFVQYWPQVAIFKKYLGAADLYLTASPASCPAVTTSWSDDYQACLPVDTTPQDWGSVSVPSVGGTVDVPIPASAQSWQLLGHQTCAGARSGTTVDNTGLSPVTGTGAGTVSYLAELKWSSTSTTTYLCVLVIDQTSHLAHFGEISLVQAATPAAWTISVDLADGGSVPNGTPTISGTLTDATGAPVAGQAVTVNVDDDQPYTLLPGACLATTDTSGHWACALGQSVVGGAHKLHVKAADCSSSACQWGEVTSSFTVTDPGPAAPTITTPTPGQVVAANGSSAVIFLRGDAAPGATVLVSTGARQLTVTADSAGAWMCGVHTGQWAKGPITYTVTVAAVVGGTRSAPASITFTINGAVQYALAVTSDAAAADGVDTDVVTVTQLDGTGSPAVKPTAFTATATTGDQALTILTPAISTTSGIATLRFTSAQAGPHQMQIWVDGQPMPVLVAGGPMGDAAPSPITLRFDRTPTGPQVTPTPQASPTGPQVSTGGTLTDSPINPAIPMALFVLAILTGVIAIRTCRNRIRMTGSSRPMM
ncbi:MAG: substrate-binding domain-containing protein [Propionibacteriaceae bacterium]|nr:substrate-binding domain-containing protein [Propionibacteriaceae bacterium]